MAGDHRRLRLVALAALAVSGLSACASELPAGPEPSPTTTTAAPTLPSPAPTSTTPARAAPAPTGSPTPDPTMVVRYRVVVDGAGLVPDTVAAEVDRILGDDRGWRRAGFVLVRDGPDAPRSDLPVATITVAEGTTVDRLCEPYDTFGRYSCQIGPTVNLNADRWRGATPKWTGSLEDYRVYLVNHEVGHLLGLHHPRPQCPGAGYPAPIMLQQSTELGACTANPWPLAWEIELAASRVEPFAPGYEPDPEGRPSPPPARE